MRKLKANRKFHQLITLMIIITMGWSTGKVIAQSPKAALNEDTLNYVTNLPWAAGGFPFSQVTEIRDSLVNTPVGRVVIDRFGEDPGKLFKAPFSAPRPGRKVIVSIWGSKIEGCFVGLVIQVAPTERISQDSFIPKRLDIGVGNEVIKLASNPDAGGEFSQFSYTYQEEQRTLNGTWYLGFQIFPVDAGLAQKFSKAQIREVKARVLYKNNQTDLFVIGKETVRGWKNTYGFNKSCSE